MADLVFPGQPAGIALNASAMPKNKDIVIYKGDYVDLYVPVTDEAGAAVNLTGYSARASLKTSYADSSPVLFTCTISDPMTGIVRVYLPSALSSDLTVGSYIYDIEIVNHVNDVRTVQTGDITVYPEVTTTNAGAFGWTVNADPASFRGDASGNPSASGQYLYTRFNIIVQYGTLTDLTCTVNTQTTGGANGISTAVLASPPVAFSPNAPTNWNANPAYGTNATTHVLTAVSPGTVTLLQANWTGIASADFPVTYTFSCSDTPNTQVVLTATLPGTTPYLAFAKSTITKVNG